MSLNAWQARGSHFDYRGHKIFLRSGGEATQPALLLIHGFPTASWDWHRQWDALCRRFRVIAPDLIGFGFSAKPTNYAYSIMDQADLCAAAIHHSGFNTVRVLAHDYGDTVAQELLARHLDGGSLRLHSLCLLNGGLFPETHRARPIQKLLHTPLGPLISGLTGERQFRRSLSAVFGAGTQPTADELHDFWQLVAHNDGARIFHKLIRYMAERRRYRPRWVGALQRGGIPTRLINGLADPVSGAHMVARYRELVATPDIVELPGIGHYPQCEAPAAVLHAFMEFQDTLSA